MIQRYTRQIYHFIFGAAKNAARTPNSLSARVDEAQQHQFLPPPPWPLISLNSISQMRISSFLMACHYFQYFRRRIVMDPEREREREMPFVIDL
jgi:hypothetical protein